MAMLARVFAVSLLAAKLYWKLAEFALLVCVVVSQLLFFFFFCKFGSSVSSFSEQP